MSKEVTGLQDLKGHLHFLMLLQSPFAGYRTCINQAVIIGIIRGLSLQRPVGQPHPCPPELARKANTQPLADMLFSWAPTWCSARGDSEPPYGRDQFTASK